MSNSKPFEVSFVDIYNEPNLKGDNVQVLPLFLTINFKKKVDIRILVKDPSLQVIETIIAEGSQNASNIWKINILESIGKWMIELQYSNKIEKINFSITSKLFEEYYDKYTEILEQGAALEYLEDLNENLPDVKGIMNITADSKVNEIHAHWLELDPGLKLSRFIDEDIGTDMNLELNHIPLILIHGFNSNHTTWNYMVRYFWQDGFRNIFAFTMLSDKEKISLLTNNLTLVIDKVLEICETDRVYLITHSLGGLMSRYYLKYVDQSKVRLLVTMSTSHYGINKIFARVVSFIKKAPGLESTIVNDRKSEVNITAAAKTEADLYSLTMVNICGAKIRGGDGLFKAMQVPDMINYEVNGNHLETNKMVDSYYLIRGILFKNFSIFKIRLLYILNKTKKENEFFLNFISEQSVKPQLYPQQGNIIKLDTENFVPSEPLIVFANFSKNKTSEKLEIAVLDKNKKVIKKENKIIAVSTNEPITDLFTIEWEGYSFQFAVYSHFLDYN